jgi:single-strand DNA-binding protein
MSNLNKVFLMGRLTRDPELRYTPQGVPVSDLGLAVNREYTPSGGGERKKDTVFIDVTVWKRQAEVCCQYLRKGSPIFIEGRLSMDAWEQDGQKRSRIKVVAENFQFIGGKGAGDAPPDAEGSRPQGGEYGSPYRRGAPAQAPAQPTQPAQPAPPTEAEPPEDYGVPPGEETPF